MKSYIYPIIPFYFILLLFIVFGCSDNTLKKDKEGWIHLFNNETLSGWEGNKSLFEVNNNSITVNTKGQPLYENEYLCTTHLFKNFDLRIKVKLEQGSNSGIQFRSVRIPDQTEVIGYQCDIGFEPTRLLWGGLYDNMRRRQFLQPLKPEVKNHLKEWNDIRIRSVGNTIKIWVNGFQTVDYRERDPSIAREGSICLQTHFGPMLNIQFKDIKLKEL